MGNLHLTQRNVNPGRGGGGAIGGVGGKYRNIGRNIFEYRNIGRKNRKYRNIGIENGKYRSNYIMTPWNIQYHILLNISAFER